MSGIAIYVEGGGDSSEQKATFRIGISEFFGCLREMARERRWKWKVVPCGSRNFTFDAYCHSVQTAPDQCSILLVNSEQAVLHSPKQHLINRDGWAINDFSESSIHLMVQTMETWIVADPDALAAYYGQQFRTNVLPRTQLLEDVPKAQLANALNQATENTQKGRYNKIRHGSDLLRRVDPKRAKERCPSCRRFFDAVAQAVGFG